MKINYALVESDYVHFASEVPLNDLKKRNKWFRVLLIVLLLVNCIAFVWGWSDLFGVLLPFTICIFVWRFIIWFFFLRPEKVAACILKNEKQRQLMLGNQSVELLDDTMIFITEAATTQFNWQSISELKETDKYIYLFMNQVSYIIIPKRVFKNELELADFKQIVERNRSRRL